MVQIEHGAGRFYVAGDGKDLAEIVYRLEETTGDIVIDHTYVSEDLRGQGAGEELVRAVVDKARTEKLKIVPVCSYAAHQFKKHPEYEDVLSGDESLNS
ncbi:GNAT family N-acetyltransferase [Paenibacillus monticola]|uniref:GNAT family N-acetyltransferase n=1 Tax=Paenibacillus monticola TaxID=2666075 RepID=A0A7X2H4C6_9BACL|nr:GNAT family N-acetyltransferase [Paenibacillus monticola]MRN53284.1 GNAT family N-acetyltransferase [Paenibacillus monticola]